MKRQNLPVYAVLALFHNKSNGKLFLERSLVVSQHKRLHLPAGEMQLPRIDADLSGQKRRFHFLYGGSDGAMPYLVPTCGDSFDRLLLCVPASSTIVARPGSSVIPVDRMFEIFLPGEEFRGVISMPGLEATLALSIERGVATVTDGNTVNLRAEIGEPALAAIPA